MNQVVEIPADSFERAINGSDKPVIVEFWIKSCEKCQKFRPIYEKLTKIFGDKADFLKINMFQSLENLKLAESLGVEETPTVKLFCKSREIGQIIGYRSLDESVREIEEILEREVYCQEKKVQ